MWNFVRSEWYRIFRSKEIYVVTGTIAGLFLLIDIVIFSFSLSDESFAYGTVKYAMSLILGNPALLSGGGAILATYLCEEENKQKTLKNTVAYGISRERIFAGKCLALLSACILSMTVILLVHTGAAVLLLEGPSGEYVIRMLFSVAAALPFTIGSTILVIAAYTIYEKEMTAVIVWVLVIMGIPKLFMALGVKFEVLARIAGWMAFNNFQNQSAALNLDKLYWETGEGLFRFLVSGFAAILIFFLYGIWKIKRKEF